MNKQQLIEKLTPYVNGEHQISAVLYFLLKVDDELILKKVDVSNELQQKITNQFISFVNDKFINNDDLSYLNLSTHDERKNIAYRYDFEQIPEELDFFNDVNRVGEIDTFNFGEDFLDDLFGHITVVGNEEFKLTTFRKHHPIDFVKRDRRLYIFPAAERFVEMQRDGFILNKGYDLIKVNGDLIVISLKTLEKYFSFDKVLEVESEEFLVTIEASNFIENIDELKEFASLNKSYQRKLIGAKNTPVLGMQFNAVSSFVATHPKLKNILKLNEAKSAFNLSSANSKKIFIKLLNDDYLNSDLTDLNYTANSKDKIEVNEE
tara:strand:- start:22398 stop:23357 length:960 start_codon:yes stop_codon:yes gene_type:complete